MTRLLGAILLLIAAAATVAAGWYYRPWSAYSPAGILAAMNDPARLPEASRTMDSVFPFSPIAATAPAPLPRNPEPLAATFEYEGEARTLRQHLEDATALGLVVMRDGVIVHERYMNGADARSRMTSWSVAKSFIATMIAMALHEGRIESLDQTAETFAPEYAGTDYGRTSLRHLLMMSAGVRFSEDYSARDSDIRELFQGGFLGSNVDRISARVVRDREPGQDLHYVSANTQVLSAVVRGVYEGPLAEIVQDRVWTPLGMESDAFWTQNVQGRRGVGIGYCCLNATLADYARLGQLYLQDGVWAGERLLPEGWVEMATRPNAPFQEPNATYRHRGYGLHFWMPEDAQGEYFAAGIYGQYIWVDERRGVVIARAAADPQWGARTAESIAAFRAIAEAVSPLQERPA